ARGRKAAMGMTWVEFKALLVEEFCPSNEIEKLKTHRKVYKRINTLNSWNAPTMIMSAILKAGILTDEAVRYGTLTRSSDKRREVEETSKQGEGGPCRLCFNCQKPGHFARDCRAPVKQVAYVSVVRMGNNQSVCYEFGSSGHLRNTCPKLNRAPGQEGNRLALEGNHNTRNNGNQARRRAFSVNAVDTL
ncbi:reverse transcriptase domain-containing protein, partial [Tanacetum coccineum]